MEWLQILTLIVGNLSIMVPLFLWNRSESRAHYRHLESGVNSQLAGIREEIKDFHGRLCSLEEKYLQNITKK